MKLLSTELLPAPRTVVVDTSWLMWRSRYAAFHLSVELGGERVPTGHLHGSLMTLLNLSTFYDRVILAIDLDSCRKTVYPEYKAHRVKPDASPYDSYRIRGHTPQLLGIACALPNVYFCRHEGLEADDIINALIDRGDQVDVFGSDNDLLQSRKPFRMFKDLGKDGPVFVDVPAYIRDKYKLEDFSYLPIWYKVIRGDSSDNLPPAAPRYNGKLLVKLCRDLQDSQSLSSLAAYIDREADSKLAQSWPALERNHAIVCPIVPKTPLQLYRIEDYPSLQTISRFQLNTVLAALQFFPGSVLQ